MWIAVGAKHRINTENYVAYELEQFNDGEIALAYRVTLYDKSGQVFHIVPDNYKKKESAEALLKEIDNALKISIQPGTTVKITECNR